MSAFSKKALGLRGGKPLVLRIHRNGRLFGEVQDEPPYQTGLMLQPAVEGYWQPNHDSPNLVFSRQTYHGLEVVFKGDPFNRWKRADDNTCTVGYGNTDTAPAYVQPQYSS